MSLALRWQVIVYEPCIELRFWFDVIVVEYPAMSLICVAFLSRELRCTHEIIYYLWQFSFSDMGCSNVFHHQRSGEFLLGLSVINVPVENVLPQGHQHIWSNFFRQYS